MTKGQVVTFYSYKGGVGRSFALANIAATLAEWGHKVLCIDWDLEAPGLNYYFRKWTVTDNSKGLLPLIDAFARGRRPRWRSHVTTVRAPRTGNRLSFLPAGQKEESYVEKIQAIDWDDLYSARGFGSYLEEMRSQWKRGFDFVFIDSRTGISDIGGICTVQLPDTLVFMFTANHQSLDGACDVARRSLASRAQLPFERNRLVTLPVLSRYEQRVEFKIATRWDRQIVAQLAPFYKSWLSVRTPSSDILKHTRIPYVAYWTFGEQLPVVMDHGRNDDPEAVNYSLLNIAALIAHGMNEANQLVSSRESYLVRSRRSRRSANATVKNQTPLIFVSHQATPGSFLRRLRDGLKTHSFRVVSSDDFASEARSRESLLDALKEARAFVSIVDRDFSGWQLEELEWYISLSIREAGINRVIPVIRSDAALRRLPKVLLSLPIIDGRSRNVGPIVDKIIAEIAMVSKTDGHGAAPRATLV